MTMNWNNLDLNYRYVADEYYSPEHETCRSFEFATEYFFRESLVGLEIPEGGITLDIGSGAGLSRRYLGEEHSDVLVELDMQVGMLRQAEGARVQGNALALPFANASLDKVTGFLFDPFNCAPLEEEVYRVLKPGGLFIGTLPSWDWASSLRYIKDMQLNQTKFRLTGTNIDIFVPSYTSPPTELESRFRSVEFSDVQLIPIFPDPTKPVSRHIQQAAQLLGKMPAELEVLTLIRAAKL